MVGELIGSGMISDPGMVYFDIRPSAHLPTVELRVCDACPAVDDIVLIAGLFRALVQAPELDAGRRARTSAGTSWCARPAGGRPAPAWRASWSTRSADAGPAAGDLVGRWWTPAPAAGGVGDWELVSALPGTLSRGSSAARQRRAFARRGELSDVVDVLLAYTQGPPPAHEPPASVPIASELLTAYHAGGFDEAVSQAGMVLPHYGWMFRAGPDRPARPGRGPVGAALRAAGPRGDVPGR